MGFFNPYFFVTWLCLKAEGELAVKEAFPEATIVRPAKLFGNDDRLLTWIANMATRMGRVPMVRMRGQGAREREIYCI